MTTTRIRPLPDASPRANGRLGRRSRQALASTLLVAMTSAGAATSVSTRQAAVETPETVARALLDEALAPLVAARGANVLVNVTPADARRTPAPCDRFTAYLPPGARLVGRTLVGVRCLDGSSWQAFVPAEVRVDAPTWAAARALHAGETIGAADLILGSSPMTQADVDGVLAVSRGSNAGIARGMATIDGRQPPPLGRVVLRPVAMGRALASSDVRDEGRINAGEAVRVVYSGEGFSVTSEGRAVGPADPGATIQIRLASGTVVNGTLRSDHLVELPR